MPTTPLSTINPCPDNLGTSDTFVGVRNLGGGNFEDLLFTGAQMLAYLNASNKKLITVPSSGTTIVNSFFSNTISKATTQGQCYLAGVDFTQSGTTITGVTISFAVGQQILFEL